MRREEAERIAAAALGWMAGQEGMVEGFLASTGAAPEDLRRAASDPAFLGFVLDYLLGDEEALLACAEATGTPPDRYAPARAALPGGDLPHWT